MSGAWLEIELCHKLLYTGLWKFRGKTEARANLSPLNLRQKQGQTSHPVDSKLLVSVAVSALSGVGS